METALITGASGGIGLEIAKELAKKGIALLLVARNESKLKDISKELNKTYEIPVYYLALDLSVEDNLKLIYQFIESHQLFIKYLVNNAGFGDYGFFVDRSLEKYKEMIQLNIFALVELTHVLAKKMVERNEGFILNVASVAAYQPNPNFAIYGATKSFVVNFSEALHKELEHTQVSCTVLSPGVTKTNFMDKADMAGAKIYSSGVMTAEVVAKKGVSAMFKRQLYVIPGFKNRFLTFFSNIMPPGKVRLSIAAKIMERK